MGRQPHNSARMRDPGEASATLWLAALGMLLVLAALLFAWWLPARLADPTTGVNPIAWAIQIVTGARYPHDALAPAVVLTVIIVGSTAMVPILLLRRGRSRSRFDDRTASMATRRDLAVMIGQGAADDAARLGADIASPGPPVALLLPTRELLRATWEWVQLWIMGPRSGKTTCVCVPQVVDTAGPAVCTTNKRDLPDLTRGPRSMRGAVYVFDPQQIIGEDPSWWWNPLSFVTDFRRAQQMAGLFAAFGVDDGARTDAYFDTEAENYLAMLLLAAAKSGEQITTVLEWASKPNDDTPAVALQVAGEHEIADMLYAVIQLSDRQRDGVVGTARKSLRWLGDQRILPWITTHERDERPQFDPVRFSTSTQTLYIVSREGAGTAGAIAASLTVAVMEAAEQIASTSTTGRLPLPMMVVLDEAANVVRWRDLPDLYSHYGSRGIIISTFLQSWNQGVSVWGRDGMAKLWSAANVRCVGAGVAQADFLQDLSTLIGDRDALRTDTSSSSARSLLDGQTTSRRLQRERILEPGELAALPRDRAVMLTSGAPAALVELQHWTACADADEIAASTSHYAKVGGIA